MKCKNCAASYSIKELRCPYCGAINPKGWMQKQQRKQAQSDYQTASTKTVGPLRRQMVNRVLNRTLLVEGIVFVLLIAGVFLTFFLQDFFLNVKKSSQKDTMNAHMEELYTQERFLELRQYIDQNHLFSEVNDDYSQMALMYYHYDEFKQSRMTYFCEQDELKEFHVKTLLWNMNKILQFKNVMVYSKLTERNKVLWDKYTEDAEIFATSVLGLNDAQMQILTQERMSSDETDQLVEAIMQGRNQNAE